MEIYQGSKTLVILHGWQSSKEEWQKVKELVEESGIKVIIPDLPGFKKENELDRAWSLDDYVEWVRRFIEENAYPERAEQAEGTCGELAEPFFLLGHSFGGRIAIKLAVQYPEKLSGLILVSAAGVTPRPKIKIGIFWFFSKIGNSIFSLPILKVFRPLARKAVYFLAGKKDYKAIHYSALKKTFKIVIEQDLTNLLSQIKTPTLLIWGEKDRSTPLKDAYLMKEKINNSQLEIFKNINHVPYLQDPKLLSQKIVNFIFEI